MQQLSGRKTSTSQDFRLGSRWLLVWNRHHEKRAEILFFPTDLTGAFISTSNNKHVPLDLLSQRRSGFGVSALGSVEPGRAINTGWIPVDLGGMMGNRPKEEAIKSQCADKIEIGRAAPQIHTHTRAQKANWQH